MSPTNLLALLALVSLVLTSCAHSLSDDGAASVLEHFGITWRLPKASVYVSVLFCTFGSGAVDNLLAGNDWQHALIVAGTSLVASIFGAARQQSEAAKGTKPPPTITMIPVLLVVALGLSSSGCSLFTSSNAKTALDIAQITCAIAHSESQDATVATVCGVADALIPDLEKLLAEHRKQVAAARRLGACGDGGAK